MGQRYQTVVALQMQANAGEEGGGGEGGGEGGSMIRQTQPKYSDVSDRRRPRVPGEKTQLVPVQLRISQQSASLLHSPLITHAVGGGGGCGGGCGGGGGNGGG